MKQTARIALLFWSRSGRRFPCESGNTDRWSTRARLPAACGKAGGGTINVPISCGGTAINPGDIIAGDADGVVVIPRPIEQDVLKEALKKLELDNERAKNILGNPEAVKKYLNDVLS